MDETSQSLVNWVVYVGLFLLIALEVIAFAGLCYALRKVIRAATRFAHYVESLDTPAICTTSSTDTFSMAYHGEEPGEPQPTYGPRKMKSPPLTDEGLAGMGVPPPDPPSLVCGVCKQPIRSAPIRGEIKDEKSVKIYECDSCKREVEVAM